MANYRGGRINEEVRREVSNIIQNEIKDPRLTAMVSVTAVKVTKDLRYAKVFVSIFGKDEEEKNNRYKVLDIKTRNLIKNKKSIKGDK